MTDSQTWVNRVAVWVELRCYGVQEYLWVLCLGCFACYAIVGAPFQDIAARVVSCWFLLRFWIHKPSSPLVGCSPPLAAPFWLDV